MKKTVILTLPKPSCSFYCLGEFSLLALCKDGLVFHFPNIILASGVHAPRVQISISAIPWRGHRRYNTRPFGEDSSRFATMSCRLADDITYVAIVPNVVDWLHKSRFRYCRYLWINATPLP